MRDKKELKKELKTEISNLKSANSAYSRILFYPSSAPRDGASATKFLPHPSRHPFLYLTGALVAGIVADRWIEPGRFVATAIALFSIILFVRFLITGNSVRATAAILVAFIQAGALLSSTERAGINDSRLKRLYETGRITRDRPVELTGVLVAPPEPAPSACYLDLEAETILARNVDIKASGRARLMLRLDDMESEQEFNRLQLDYGSRLRVLVRLERARSYNNPGSPDFNDYLERSGYDLKGVIKSPLLIEHISVEKVNLLLDLLYKARLGFLSSIDRHFEPRTAGTLKAMLVDNRHFLDPQAGERLREGATYHVLSISGMHVAIIAWALLGGRTRPKRRRALRLIISLVVLWAYAIMVGLSPPVTRATVMITVGLTGLLVFRRAASINTVSLAAFIMLALKPALVADPAFQLSFIAVAAIVALAVPITDKLRAIGEWRPSARTPHPPRSSRATRLLAETLFWDERKFNEEMRRSPVRYRLEKARAARWLGRLRLQRLARATVLLIITSSAIQLATLPLMAMYFNRVSPVGILLNVVAGVLTGFLMLAATAVIALGALSASLSAWLATAVEAAHYLLVNSVVPFRDMPGAGFRVAHYEGWQTIIYAAYFAPLSLLAILIDRWRPVAWKLKIDRRQVKSDLFAASPRPRVAVSALCALALFACTIAVLRPINRAASGKLTLHFLDVGQGDAALIIFPGGATMLVDGGGEPSFYNEQKNPQEVEIDFKDNSFGVGETVVSRFLWSLGLTKIDYVLVTHAHADHVGGLSQVVKNFRVGQAVIGRAPDAHTSFDDFRGAILRRGIPAGTLSAGERFEIQGVAIEVLWPPVTQAQAQATSGNNDSVVLRMGYGSVSILLAGDIEQPTETALVRGGTTLRAEVLKVPHHGSRTSSSGVFIDAVRPECAVISVGERSQFGHPHLEVLERYLARSAKLYQTGRDGMVTVETDGAAIDLKTYKSNGLLE